MILFIRSFQKSENVLDNTPFYIFAYETLDSSFIDQNSSSKTFPGNSDALVDRPWSS